MQINKAVFRNLDGIPVLTLNGTCTVGHKRRMNEVEIEGPVFLSENVIIEAKNIGGYTSIGKNTVVKRTVHIGRYTTIGEDCRIGEQVRVDNHGISNSYVLVSGVDYWYKRTYAWDMKKLQSSPKRKSIIIGNDVWIGNNVIIYEGVTIGDGCIINCGSVVTEDVLPYSIVQGNPAKVDGKRFEEDVITILEKVQWWNLPLEIINQIDKDNFISDLHRLSGEEHPKGVFDKAIVKSEMGTIEISAVSKETVLYKV